MVRVHVTEVRDAFGQFRIQPLDKQASQSIGGNPLMEYVPSILGFRSSTSTVAKDNRTALWKRHGFFSYGAVSDMQDLSRPAQEHGSRIARAAKDPRLLLASGNDCDQFPRVDSQMAHRLQRKYNRNGEGR
jgi:hypothetical protein